MSTVQILFGDRGVEMLINEIQKFPEVYKVRLVLVDTVAVLPSAAQSAWVRIVDEMQKTFGPQLTSESCWKTWRNLSCQQRVASSLSPKPNKWAQHLAFLDGKKEPKGCNDFEATASGASKEKPLAYDCGDDSIRFLIDEVSLHPEFHDYEFVRKHENVAELDGKSAALWAEIVSELQESFPAASSQQAWRAWRNLRTYHNRSAVRPQKWRTNLSFLDALDRFKEESDVEIAAPQRQNASGAARECIHLPLLIGIRLLVTGTFNQLSS